MSMNGEHKQSVGEMNINASSRRRPFQLGWKTKRSMVEKSSLQMKMDNDAVVERIDACTSTSDGSSSNDVRLGSGDLVIRPRYVSTDDVRDSSMHMYAENVPASVVASWDMKNQRNADFDDGVFAVSQAHYHHQGHSSASAPSLEGMQRRIGQQQREFIPPPLTAIAEEPGSPSSMDCCNEEPPACIPDFTNVPSSTLKRMKPTSSLSSLCNAENKAASISPSSAAIDLYHYQTSSSTCEFFDHELPRNISGSGCAYEGVFASEQHSGSFDEWGHFVEEGANSAGRSRSEFFYLIGTKRQY
mmetsp:Transcript_8547/g.12638  ORF Transcript_8547/g.12638 Transcript_8547/m.12638 type:complete len:301 (-) Transcript_8547:284-1186(-)